MFVESVVENLAKRVWNLFEIKSQNGQRSENIDHDHQWNDPLGDKADPSDSAHCDESDEEDNSCAGNPAWNFKTGIEGLSHCVGLDHVADSESRDTGEARIHDGEPFPDLAETIF